MKHAISTISALLLHSVANADNFLSSWMSLPLFRDLSLSDLTLAGTHDSLTYDLSHQISEGAWDDSDFASHLMHELHLGSSLGVGEWIKSLAQTQGLNVTEQLDNGVRRIDFRMMREPDTKLWYSLHFVQSNQLAQFYFKEIRQWLDSHPSEIVIVEISKHGSNSGPEAYPGVANADRLEMFYEIKKIFDGLMFDHTISSFNETTIGQLQASNQRVVLLIEDYFNMTLNSPFVQPPSQHSWGVGGGGVWNVTDQYVQYHNEGPSIGNTNRWAKEQNRLTYIGFNNAETNDQVEDLAYMHFLPFFQKQKHHDACSSLLDLKGCNYCPTEMLQLAQLSGYYMQIVIEDWFVNGYEFPNVISFDALDVDGCVRTSSNTDWTDKDVVRYAVVDTLLAVNIKRACSSTKKPADASCDELTALISKRRASHPYLQWDDVPNGRVGFGFPASLPGFPPSGHAPSADGAAAAVF